MQKGKYEHSGLVLISGTGEKGRGGRFSLDFVCLEFGAICVLVLCCAISVQRISLTSRCFLLYTDRAILPLDVYPWLV